MRVRLPFVVALLATTALTASIVKLRLGTPSRLPTTPSTRNAPGPREAPSSPARETRPDTRYDDSEASPIEPLDRCTQERFRGFAEVGMSRMSVLPHNIGWFNPKTPEEQSAVAKLRQLGWTVSFYLGGRGLLGPPLSKAEWDEAGDISLHRVISKPLRITGADSPLSLPTPWELRDIGRQAMASFTTGDKYEASLGKWRIDARPIRASQRACLKCHAAENAAGDPLLDEREEPAPSLGDALGVAIYVYSRPL